MGLLDLFFVASMPVVKLLLLTALGSFLASDAIDVLGENARKQLNNVVFYVFNPALVCSNLAKTITFESIVLLWFMPLNILFTFVIGSALGWLLIKITRASQHLKGLILGCCAAGNLGNLPLVIIPAVCSEKGSPFGAPEVCKMYGMAYASLSMAIGAIYLWSYVYNIVRVFSVKTTEEVKTIEEVNKDDLSINTISTRERSVGVQKNCTEILLPSKDCSYAEYEYQFKMPCTKLDKKAKEPVSSKIKQIIRMLLRNINLKAMFAPSTTGTIVGFMIGIVPPIQKLFVGDNAPFHVVEDSALLLAYAAIPSVSLIVGGNLLKGFKGSGVHFSLIVGIVAVRYIFLPLFGVFIVKSAIRFGMVHSDPLFQFVLLLQYALPPAMNIGVITQLFGACESECAVILLWTYASASVSLTLWSTFFMWLVV